MGKLGKLGRDACFGPVERAAASMAGNVGMLPCACGGGGIARDGDGTMGADEGRPRVWYVGDEIGDGVVAADEWPE
jgi:hypothetical protein